MTNWLLNVARIFYEHDNTFILYANWSTKKRRGMDLYMNGGNIRLGNCRRFTSLTMYNLHIFYLAPLMFSRGSHFLISGLHAENTKIKDQPHWVVLLDLCQFFSFHAWLLFPSMHVASADRFVSFKAGGDRRDGSFFFYRVGYRTG